MKHYIKWLLVLLGVVSFSSLFAQRGRYTKRYHDRYAYAWQPYHYAPLRTSVSIVARVPFGAVAVTFGSRHYRYFDGIYYEPMQRGYIIVQPPLGIVVPVLPAGYVSLMIGGRYYYRYQNVYYMPLGSSGYQVVPEPEEDSQGEEAIAGNSGSDGYEKLVLDGKTYYKKGNKYYKAKVNDNGEIVYEETGEASK